MGDGMMANNMNKEEFSTLVKPHSTVDKDGILVAKEIADKTVWDKLAVENPTDAVISATDEAEAARKSAEQITDIKQFLKPGDVLLDCGTGYGRVAKYLLPGMTLSGYIGVDSSYEMLSLFKQRYDKTESEQKTPLLLLNADIHTLPVLDDSVDVVLVSAVFLHNHKSIVSRAVTQMDDFVKWTRKKIAKKNNHELKNGILYLKGGDLTEELQNFPKAVVFDLSNYFEEDFFETKKVVHIPLKYKPSN